MELTIRQKYPIGFKVMHKEHVIPDGAGGKRPLTAVVVGHSTEETDMIGDVIVDVPGQEVLLLVEWTFEDEEGERCFGEDMWSESEIFAANPQLVN